MNKNKGARRPGPHILNIPAKCPGGLLKFYRGCISKNFHRDRIFFTGVQYKGCFYRSLKFTGDAEILTGDPRW